MLRAKEAREIMIDALSADSEVILPYLNYIEEKIIKAAQRGKHEISHPFAGLPNREYPQTEVQKAIRKVVENNGFIWADHPNPDPGDPRRHPYTTISW